MKKRIIAILLAVSMAAGENMMVQASGAELSQAEILEGMPGASEGTEPGEEIVSGEDFAAMDSQVSEGEAQEDGIQAENPEETQAEGTKAEEDKAEGSEEAQSGETEEIDLEEAQSEQAGEMNARKQLAEEPEPEENLPGPEEGINLLEEGGIEIQEAIRGAGNYYEQEPNNSVPEANAIALGTTVSGSLTDNDEGDYYKITLPVAGALSLHLRSNDLQNVSVCVYFDEAEEKGVFWGDNEWNENLKLLDKDRRTYLEPGTYYIVIYKRDGCTGNYTCEVQFTNSGTNDGEPNNSFDEAKSLNMGSSITGQISCNDQADYYKINVGSVGKVTLNMISYMEYYGVILYDGEQKEIWSETNNYWNENAGMRQDTYALYLEPGTYYIKVKSRDSSYYYYRGLYKMNLSFTATSTSFTGDDNSAVNSKPISWNKTYTGQISVNDDYDTYTFALTKSRNIPISFSSNMRTYKIKMYDAAGKTVWETEPSYYSGWNESSKSRKDSYTVTLSAGTYYMEVSGRSDWTGTYSFSLSAGELTSLKLSKNSVKLVKGKKYQLNPLMEPVNCKVTWKTDNSKVATVNSGKITAKGYGQASITCYAQDGSNKTASCKVTVVPAKAKISSAKSGKSYRKIKIKSQSGVTGYEVYTKTKRSSWKLYKTIKGAKNKSLKVKNKFYNTHSFKVRAYKQIGSKKYYGAFSKAL